MTLKPLLCVTLSQKKVNRADTWPPLLPEWVSTNSHEGNFISLFGATILD